MARFLKYFIIGLAVGVVVLYQLYRERVVTNEIGELRQSLIAVSMNSRSSGPGSPQTMPLFSDVPQPTGKFSTSQNAINDSRRNAITEAIAATSDAVVGINVVQLKEFKNPLIPKDPFFRMFYDEHLWPQTVKRRVENLGSGFIISQDGYIVTNEHVVRDAEKVVITTTQGQKYDAVVVGTDPLLDMALLRIDCTNLPCIRWGDSNSCIVGEWAIAIGNPYGLFDVNDQPSVSVGVISALHRDFERDSDGRLYSDMIQTDAAINRGNSGGPLVNSEGEAVGMNTLIFTESGGSVGVGFAIPSARIMASIDDLLKGGVNRNYWIGIRASDLIGIMHRKHGLKSNEGAVVTGVEPGSPAAKAGVKFEDVILEINDQPVVSANAAKKMLENTDLRVGDKLTLKISRKGKIVNAILKLAPKPSQG